MTAPHSLASGVTRAVVKMPAPVRRVLIILWDAASWVVALALFLLVRYDFVLQPAQWGMVLLYVVVAVFLQIVIGIATHVYLGRNRVGSFGEATWLGAVVALAGWPWAMLLDAVADDFPRGIGLIVPLLALLVMAAGRWLFRVFWTAGVPRRAPEAEGAIPTLVYGAGEGGHQMAVLIDTDPLTHYDLVGFIDDDTSKRYLRVHGHRVKGTGDDLARVASETGARNVILAISEMSPSRIKRVSDVCRDNGLKLIVVPPVREMIGGRVSLAALREFNVADLLGRRPIETDLSAISDYVTGKRVLVTGAGGSIGSELARQLYELGPSRLVLLDRDESALHAVQLSIYGVGLLDTNDMVLCDIRDYDALKAVFTHHRPDVVFHAAALKHLPLLELYPDEGWKTNVLGTHNVLRCAQEVGVANLVNISTDKAADATSVLGRTKRIAERLTAWFADSYDLPYVSVRFGNVLGSRGSVLYTFRAQIERGGPVTVTHPDVTRYFMTIPEACELVIQAGALGAPGDVMVLNMGEPVRIVDVAERLVAESGKDIRIHFTGLRPGEKKDEVLFSDVEDARPSVHPLINHVRVPALDPGDVPHERPSLDEVKPLLAQNPNRVSAHRGSSGMMVE